MNILLRSNYRQSCEAIGSSDQAPFLMFWVGPGDEPIFIGCLFSMVVYCRLAVYAVEHDSQTSKYCSCLAGGDEPLETAPTIPEQQPFKTECKPDNELP